MVTPRGATIETKYLTEEGIFDKVLEIVGFVSTLFGESKPSKLCDSHRMVSTADHLALCGA